MRVCVNGGDVVGLIAAHLCRALGHKVVLVEPSSVLGYSAFLPTHKYVERTNEMLNLLNDLGMAYGKYTLATGLLQRGAVSACPHRVSDAVHHAHWRKTRLTAMPVDVIGAGLTDPEVVSRRRAVSFDWHDFVKRLSAGLSVVREEGAGFASAPDVVFETQPLWESRLCKSDGFGAMAVVLNLLPVRANRERYLGWDVVYTPHTPGNAILRLYHHDETEYVCEFSGVVSEDAVTSDLNYLFPDGWHVDASAMRTGCGKLVTLDDRPVWPEHVHAIGRLAAWDEGATLTRVIRDVLAALGEV